mgnify:CR=1 FL=1
MTALRRCLAWSLTANRFYFDYQGKTWLLEFWKGQYGINTGAEIGIYRADTLLSPAQRPYTLFHTVPDENCPYLSWNW